MPEHIIKSAQEYPLFHLKRKISVQDFFHLEINLLTFLKVFSLVVIVLT